MAQRFSPELPWVLVHPSPHGGFFMTCEVCGEEGHGMDHREAHAFAYQHREHTAGEGYVGAGDAFAAVAKPIARAMGKEPCTPCEARRRAMNQIRLPWPW